MAEDRGCSPRSSSDESTHNLYSLSKEYAESEQKKHNPPTTPRPTTYRTVKTTVASIVAGPTATQAKETAAKAFAKATEIGGWHPKPSQEEVNKRYKKSTGERKRELKTCEYGKDLVAVGFEEDEPQAVYDPKMDDIEFEPTLLGWRERQRARERGRALGKASLGGLKPVKGEDDGFEKQRVIGAKLVRLQAVPYLLGPLLIFSLA